MNNEKELIKYYEFFLTGELVLDPATNTPKKGEDGKPLVKFTRDTTPSAALIAKGLTSNKWFQCEAVEVNVESDTIASASGKSWDIGPSVKKGTPVNIFHNTQKRVYEAICERYVAEKYTWVINPEDAVGTKEKPVLHLTAWALPGRVVEFETGFKYFVMNRDKETKALKRLKANRYNREGQLVEEDVIKTTGTLFLFANELSAMEAHIKDAILALEPDKVPNIAPTTRKDDVIDNQEDVKTTTSKIEGATKPITTTI